VIACASGVCICRMSHCSGDSESLSDAGAFGRSPGGGPDASLASGWAGSRVAKPAVAETPSIDVSAACRSAPKLGLDELAIATPIRSYE